MNFNKHSDIRGQHAFFSASRPHWLSYSENDILTRYKNSFAASTGTILHELAEKLIKQGDKMTKSDKHLVSFYLRDHGIPSYAFDVDYIFDNLKNYVNDAIGFLMEPEVILYYSENFFGTADAISFRKNKLRIHDLKTGETPASMEQLEVYAALFCLEYKIKPSDISTELRIYQSNEVIFHKPTVEDIVPIIDKIISINKFIEGSFAKEVF